MNDGNYICIMYLNGKRDAETTFPRSPSGGTKGCRGRRGDADLWASRTKRCREQRGVEDERISRMTGYREGRGVGKEGVSRTFPHPEFIQVTVFYRYRGLGNALHIKLSAAISAKRITHNSAYHIKRSSV